jgi:2-phosphosulfolactate phosphatase
MRVTHTTLAGVGDIADVVVVVVIDVLRAFTVASLALAAGARAIRCVATVEQALAVREANPGSLAMGEREGRPIPGFDLPNSPSALAGADVGGRLLVHRTRAGTQGLVLAAPRARNLLAASFPCAGATARAVRSLEPDGVTFVATGVDHRDGDEDIACAEYIAALLTGDGIDPEPYVRRVRSSDAARAFLSGDPDFPDADLDLAMRLDTVDFALLAQVEDGDPTLICSAPPVAG